MVDDSGSAFDAVEEGPESSYAPSEAHRSASEQTMEHPSVTALKDCFGEAVLHHEVQSGDQHVVFIGPTRNVELLTWLKSDADHAYDLLADVTAVDYGEGRPIQVVYQLWSITHRRALRVKCELTLDALSIESVAALWKTADWLEREVYDLFGVEFTGHPDLRRILMPQNYAEGHPLRKDFPLRGRFSRAEQTKRALSQDYQDYYTPEMLEMGGAPALLPSEPDQADAETKDAS